MREAKKQAQTVSAEVNKRPLMTAKNSITFLSSLSYGSTSRYNIQNRVVVVSGSRKVVANHRMIKTIQAKIEVIEHKIQEVIKLFRPLVRRGLPFF